MGSPAVRITAADFLTPPEFRDLGLANRSAGQVGGVRLELSAREGKTFLGQCYQQVPVRVLPPFHFSGEPAALVYLLNPTAGLLDGDGHLIDLTVGPGCRALVTGQSATRIHPCYSGFATQQWRIRVENGGWLVVLPGPAIPYHGCRYYQRVIIDLAPEARLAWGDVWLPGRYARADHSELFQFERIVRELEVRREGELVFRDRFGWQGPWDRETIRWHLGEHLASGSMFLTGRARIISPAESESFQRVVLDLAFGDSCIRWCGSPGRLITDLVSVALREAALWAEDSGVESPWFLRRHNLAPTHWFSAV